MVLVEMPDSLESAAGMARVFACPLRLRLTLVLRAGEACVCDLPDLLGVSWTTLTDHPREPRRLGIVEAHRHGRRTDFQLAESDAVGGWIELAARAARHDSVLTDDPRGMTKRLRARRGNGSR